MHKIIRGDTSRVVKILNSVSAALISFHVLTQQFWVWRVVPQLSRGFKFSVFIIFVLFSHRIFWLNICYKLSVTKVKCVRAFRVFVRFFLLRSVGVIPQCHPKYANKFRYCVLHPRSLANKFHLVPHAWTHRCRCVRPAYKYWDCR